MNEWYRLSVEDRVETVTPAARRTTEQGEPPKRSALGAMTQRSAVLMACALLLILALALFHRALGFVPENGDDLRLLSSVVHTTQPLKPLIGDWGQHRTRRAATVNTGRYIPFPYGSYTSCLD